ncbi:hypothetical protein HD554DRAFT_2068276 [Boletus coccyginus]|nr:hypothetical protein HD554DRAFT_2068276 [Boletus coccyginus]
MRSRPLLLSNAPLMTFSLLMLFRPALFIAGAGLAVAQSISDQCTSAVLDIAASPDATCLDLGLLAPLALTNASTTSVIPTVDTWLTGVCGLAPCSNASLQAVVANITVGCASDLASFGVSTTNATTVVQAAYPTVRQIACLKDTSAKSLCVTELMNSIQSASTTLSLNNIVGLMTQVMSGENINIPQNVTCSDCTKAAYSIAAQGYPSLVTGQQAYLQSNCGSSFTDGQMPSTIQETASNSTSSTGSTGGAASLSVSSLNVGIAMLFAVSSAFAMFA